METRDPTSGTARRVNATDSTLPPGQRHPGDAASVAPASHAPAAHAFPRASILASILVILCLSLLILPGCGRPSAANTQLRKEIQDLKARIAQLEAELASYRAPRPDQQTSISSQVLDRLFVTSGIRFNRLNTGRDRDANAPGDEGVTLSFTPVDQVGHDFKTSGRLDVELFDLAADQPRIGQWSIPFEELRGKWVSSAVIDAYVLELDWQTRPSSGNVLAKLTFTEELTGRQFTGQREIAVNIAPEDAATRPSVAGE